MNDLTETIVGYIILAFVILIASPFIGAAIHLIWIGFMAGWIML